MPVAAIPGHDHTHRHVPSQDGHLDPQTIQALHAQGFSDIVVKRGEICALKHFVFTTGLVLGIDPIGDRLRYCYEHAHEARAALAAWDGKGHPGGPWIKCKGAGV